MRYARQGGRGDEAEIGHAARHHQRARRVRRDGGGIDRGAEVEAHRRRGRHVRGADTVALLERAPVVHLASTTPEGRPLIRTVHGVVVGGSLSFHGAPAGEKTETERRCAVVRADEIVAFSTTRRSAASAAFTWPRATRRPFTRTWASEIGASSTSARTHRPRWCGVVLEDPRLNTCIGERIRLSVFAYVPEAR